MYMGWRGRERIPVAVGSFLCQVLQGDEDDGVLDRGTVVPAGLADGAARHGIPGYVRLALLRSGAGDASTLTALTELVDTALRRHLAVLQDLRPIFAALEADGVRVAVVKGPVLTEVLHGRADLRSYTDLDLVIHPRDFPVAVAILEALGATPVVPSWRTLMVVRAGEVPVVMPSAVPVDLHWHLLNDQRLRQVFPIDMDALTERMVPVSVNDLRVHTLDPVDTLLHLGLHSCMSGNDRLLWLKDLERAVSVLPLDWDLAVDRARAWRVGLPVAVALQRARDVVGFVLPDGILDALSESRAWLALSRLTGRLAPTERAVGGPSIDRLVSRATRGTAPASAWELRRKTAARMRGRASRTELDGSSARWAYLDAVASGCWTAPEPSKGRSTRLR